MSEPLRYLSDEDWRALRLRAKTVDFQRDDMILEEGTRGRGIFLVKSGFVRVQRGNVEAPITLARLGPGQVFGEMSFLGQAATTASVCADSDVQVDVIGEDEMQAMLSSDASFSARFYHSLARTLADRLAETSEQLSELSMHQVDPLNRFRVPHTGNVSERQMPPELVCGIAAFRDQVRDIEERHKSEQISEQDANEQIASACDAVVELLDTLTSQQAALEVTVDDLLAFRDSAEVGGGLGAYVQRETYPVLMTSSTMARCYLKPRGFSDDYETIARMDSGEPEGDGRLGPMVDRWFLDRPICRSRRDIRDAAQQSLDKLVAEDSNSRVVQITSLASGTASEVFEVVSSRPAVRATCVDLDEAALGAGLQRAERLECSDRMTFMREDVTRLCAGQAHLALEPQRAVYSLGLCEYLTDEQTVLLLNWMHHLLEPAGVAMLSNLSTTNPDRGLMEHLLEWKVIHRSEDQLRALISRSTFGGDSAKFQSDETGSNILALCVKQNE